MTGYCIWRTRTHAYWPLAILVIHWLNKKCSFPIWTGGFSALETGPRHVFLSALSFCLGCFNSLFSLIQFFSSSWQAKRQLSNGKVHLRGMFAPVFVRLFTIIAIRFILTLTLNRYFGYLGPFLAFFFYLLFEFTNNDNSIWCGWQGVLERFQYKTNSDILQ